MEFMRENNKTYVENTKSQISKLIRYAVYRYNHQTNERYRLGLFVTIRAALQCHPEAIVRASI